MKASVELNTYTPIKHLVVSRVGRGGEGERGERGVYSDTPPEDE